jgi:hypothetical protein
VKRLAVVIVSTLGALALFAPSGGATAPDVVTDALGTHDSSIRLSGDRAFRRRSACGPSGRFGGGFHTSLGAGWTFLAARRGPCRAARARGGHSTGSRWKVRRETHGEEICRGRLDGRASDVWFRARKGWSWSGGTADARWNESC